MRRLRTALLATGALTTASALTAAWLSACGSTTCEEDKTCSPATGDDGGRDATNSDVGPDVAPPGCDLSKEPKDAPDCVVNAVGAFVSSSSGSDTTGDGTKEKPFASIGKGLTTLTGTAKRRVYICDGSYAETVTIDHALDGAALYGGFTCAGGAWSYSGVKPVIAPAAGGAVPLTIGGLTTGATIADLKLVAPDGQKPGESSIATFVHDSNGVSFVRAGLTAGTGAAATDGTTVESYPGDAGVAPGGNTPAASPFGALPIACNCGSEQTIGGGGGLGSGIQPGGGSIGQPDRGAGDGGAPGDPCSNGGKGGDGLAGSPGVGATSPGQILAAGWNGNSGTAGTAGHVAQGGGGGGGGKVTPGGGGSGACGGCGGGAGGGAAAGGSSIGVVAFQAGVSLDACDIKTSDAGRGGAGGSGQPGQFGGPGGIQASGGCAGGMGGTGGAGGGGGGGAGGVSIAIAFKGNAPDVTGGSQSVSSNVAPGGSAGAPGGMKGADGISQKTHAF